MFALLSLLTMLFAGIWMGLLLDYVCDPLNHRCSNFADYLKTLVREFSSTKF